MIIFIEINWNWIIDIKIIKNWKKVEKNANKYVKTKSMTKLAIDQIIFNFLRKNMMFIDEDYSDNMNAGAQEWIFLLFKLLLSSTNKRRSSLKSCVNWLKIELTKIQSWETLLSHSATKTFFYLMIWFMEWLGKDFNQMNLQGNEQEKFNLFLN